MGGRGNSSAWEKTRRFVFERDGFECQLKIPGVCTRTSNPLHAHHTHGTSTGMDPAHIVTACGPCNLHVGKPKGDPSPAEVPSWVKEALDGRGDVGRSGNGQP